MLRLLTQHTRLLTNPRPDPHLVIFVFESNLLLCLIYCISAPFTPAPTAPQFTCPPFSATDTNSATQNYATCSFTACGGSIIGASGCDACYGDQYIRLVDSSMKEVSSNDEACGSCSSLTYTVPGMIVKI
jgi:hypothetical protein